MISVRQAGLLLIAVVSINLMSLLDSINTFLLVDNDSIVELNPLMNALIEHNYLQFFMVKLVHTLAGTLICWHYYARSGTARRGLVYISRVYCAVMVWQILLLSCAMG
jgi:Domain of unknown function (DUF5658)